MAEELGDRRRLADAVGNLMELEYLQGAFDQAEALARELATAARVRNDRRYETEGLVDQVYCEWQLGRSEQAQRSLTALRRILAIETDMTDELKIKYRGLLATIELARGEHEQALAASEEVLRLTAGARPTSFGTFLGYVAPVEVYLSVWEPDSRGATCAPERPWPSTDSVNTPACFPSVARAPARCGGGTSGCSGSTMQRFAHGIAPSPAHRSCRWSTTRDWPITKSAATSIRTTGHAWATSTRPDRSSAVSMRHRRWPLSK